MIDAGYVMKKYRRYNDHGALTAELDWSAEVAAQQREHGVGRQFIGWSELQAALYTSIAERERVVHLQSKFESFDVLPAAAAAAGGGAKRKDGDDISSSSSQAGSSDLVAVRLEGQAEPVVAARLLVGSDGLFSRVRRQWLGQRGVDAPLTDAGCTIWRARVPLAAAPALCSDPNVGIEVTGGGRCACCVQALVHTTVVHYGTVVHGSYTTCMHECLLRHALTYACAYFLHPRCQASARSVLVYQASHDELVFAASASTEALQAAGVACLEDNARRKDAVKYSLQATEQDKEATMGSAAASAAVFGTHYCATRSAAAAPWLASSRSW